MEEKWIYLFIGLVIGALVGAGLQQQSYIDKETAKFLDEMCQAKGYEKFKAFTRGYVKDATGTIIKYRISIDCERTTPEGVHETAPVATVEIPVGKEKPICY